MQQDFLKSMRNFDNYFVFATEQNQLYLKQGNEQQQLSFPSPIYDALLMNGLLTVSIRNMPIGIFQQDDNNWKVRAQLHDIKPNSENFLSPLEICKLQNSNNFIGCGKGFLHEYDLQKLQVSNKYNCIKNFDFISCLDCSTDNQNITKNIIILGMFNKRIRLVDTLQNKMIGEIKIHLGGLTNVVYDKLDSMFFYSCARFDDCVYQWDLRNTSTFVKYFERKNQSNQRIRFGINRKRQLLLGNSDGTAYIYDPQSQIRTEIQCSNSCVHSAIITDDEECYLAYGQRQFNDENFETGIYNFNIQCL